MRRRPGLTAVAVLTLALGIGPATGIFSLANWIALRPVPGVRASEELAIVWYGTELTGGGFRPSWVSYPNLEDLTSSLRAWSGLAGVQTGSVHLAVAGGGAERLDARFVTAPYFRVLGVRPAVGRLFADAEDDPVQGGAPVAVISHRLWRTLFGANSETIGKTVRLNDRPFEIIGVLPAVFHGTERLEQTDVWLPGSTHPYVNHFPDSFRLDDRDTGGFYEFVSGAGRPGRAGAKPRRSSRRPPLPSSSAIPG